MERRVPREIWVKRVARWRDSGQSASDFATTHGMNADRLRHWGWRLAKENGSTATPTITTQSAESLSEKPAVVPFVEVERASARVRPVVAQPSRPEATSLEPIEIITPSGLRVRLPSKFDVDVLRRVLAVVH